VNYWLYFLSILALSQASILTRWSEASIEVLGFWRLLIAVVVLRALFLRRQFFTYPKKLKVGLYVLLAGTFLYAHFWTFFYAAQNTSIANTVLLFCLNPLTTSAVAWIFLKDRVSWKIALSFLFGMCSVVILFWPHLTGGEGGTFADLCALISALFYSIYIVAAKKGQVAGHVSGPQFSSLTFVVAAILFFIHVTVTMGAPALMELSSRAWIAVALLTLIPTLLGHALFLVLSRTLNINWMSTGKLLEPPLAALSAYFIFHQSPSTTALLSFLFLVPALILLLLGKEF
jgi:drug/metabolite transporter (DMT)-like permease